ncbi:MAG: DNA-processing protein DprA [Spiribacter sp.]|nr:DNA-processing protein DprA [Spiribacter sp.]MDR9455247.1 DNA-processing protein DprA [Spiribacter sp.]
MMTEAALRDWLTVWRLEGVGPGVYRQILDAYETPSAFLAASQADRRHHGIPPKVVQAASDAHRVNPGVDADLRWLDAEDNRHLLTQTDPRYPDALRAIPDPPPVLFVRGDLACLSAPQLGIVGSRHATPGGLHSAADFSAHLAAAGLVITSGLALGIDAEAHQGALAAGGQTIGVMATGPDRLYPREHEALAREIVDNGALITEMATGTPVKRGLFPRRNRLISGLALGVLVVEASAKSGAMNTAHTALEHNREVMAIPGSIHNPVARGCHRLIREGARLVETAEDVIEELRGLTGPLNPTATKPAPDTSEDTLDADYHAVLARMGYDPVRFDWLAEQLALTPDILSSMLLSLELKGLVKPCHGGRYMRTDNRTGG